MALEHLSVSSFGMFSRCGEQWRRRYIEGEVIPPGIAAHVGTGVHRAAEACHKHKLETGETMRVSDMADAAATAYDKALRNGVFFAPDEVDGAQKAMAQGKDNAVKLASLYGEQLAPKIDPMLVEERMMLNLPGVDLPIMAIVDLYTQDRALRDLKTAGKSWTQSQADTSAQMTLYREAIKESTGDYPASLGFDVLVNKKTPEVQQLATVRTGDDTELLARGFRTMLKAVNAGVFLPAEPGAWVCSPKWCGYFGSCPYKQKAVQYFS